MPTRLVNLEGRAQLLIDGRCVDVQKRSAGAHGTDPMDALQNWAAFCDWAQQQRSTPEDPVVAPERLGPPVPAPRQIFGVGLNYRDHAEEAGIAIPAEPMIFTKFPSCIAGPHTDIPLTGNRVDWEVELVVVIGRGGRGIVEERALEHVAGFTVGQDISDRRRQFGDNPPQFSLGKSSAAFGPIGPAVTTLDALEDPNDLRLTCAINGESMQDGRTSDMIFGVSQLVAYLSRYCELWPGDLIFTGTPSGVGSVRDRRRYLAAGDRIESEIEGLGRLDNRCVE
ncbi:MAG: fumarylacetoacetate hydrolase family protein [Myxococcales bacterium]|nr:fumarylacetoacetate hydrolase family protein [Myxococcales bacterium]